MNRTEERQIGGYTYFLDIDQKIVFIKAHGLIDFSSTMKTMEAAVSEAEFSPGFKVLVDLSDMDFHPTFKEFNGIRDKMLLLKPMLTGKVALVMVGLVKSLGDLASELVKSSGMNVRSFYSRTKALEWIEED